MRTHIRTNNTRAHTCIHTYTHTHTHLPGRSYQCGRTKIFFRAGQVAFLEKRRAAIMQAAVVVMQAAVRGFVQQRRYAGI